MHDPTLLLVDDDETFRAVLASAMQRRGFVVTEAADVATALTSVEKSAPDYAVIDLKMPGDSGLVLVRRITEMQIKTIVVVLTGYASIATAIEAIKLGATHYLAKPVDTDEILAAFGRLRGVEEVEIAPNPLTIDRLEYEHIQRILSDNGGNISATARSLNMHRRTLQRKLAKHPSK